MKDSSSKSIMVAAVACVIVVIATVLIGPLRGGKRGKSPSPDPACSPRPERFKLENGLTVILLENHKEKKVAVESFYPAGFIHEPKGKAHISHVVEHMVARCATKSYEPNESFTLLQKKGMANAETLATFAHYDYLLPSRELELAMKIESERLTSIEFSEEVLRQEIPKCLQEVEFVQNNPRAGLIKFGLVALCQTVNFGEQLVPVCAATSKLTADDVEQFHRDHYAPQAAFLIVVGDFDLEEAKKLVTKHFANVPKGRPLTKPVPRINEDTRASWDFASDAIYLVYPGPGRDAGERLVLTLFGNYLSGRLAGDADLKKATKTCFCSNQLYPVGELPFFVFAEAKQGEDIEQVENALNSLLSKALDNFSVPIFSQTKLGLASFMRVSVLESRFVPPGMKHEMLLAQEAINLGIKELLRGDRTHEEFVGQLNDLDFETADRIIKARLSGQNKKTIIFRGVKEQTP